MCASPLFCISENSLTLSCRDESLCSTLLDKFIHHTCVITLMRSLVHVHTNTHRNPSTHICPACTHILLKRAANEKCTGVTVFQFDFSSDMYSKGQTKCNPSVDMITPVLIRRLMIYDGFSERAAHADSWCMFLND